jgi:hypothetical protein
MSLEIYIECKNKGLLWRFVSKSTKTHLEWDMSLETPLDDDSWTESREPALKDSLVSRELVLIWLMKDSLDSRVREKREEESLVRLEVSLLSMLPLL